MCESMHIAVNLCRLSLHLHLFL